MIYVGVIEAPMGCKVKHVRYIRRKWSRVEPLRYRHHRSAQDARRANVRHYKVATGRAMLWPPLQGEAT